MFNRCVALLTAMFLTTAALGVASAATFTDTGLYGASTTAAVQKGSIAVTGHTANGGDILTMYASNGTLAGAWVWQGNDPTNATGSALRTLPSWATGASIPYGGANANGTLMAGRAYASNPSPQTVTPFVYTIGLAADSATNLGAYDLGYTAIGVSNSGVVAFVDGKYLLPGASSAVVLPGINGGSLGDSNVVSGNGNIGGTIGGDSYASGTPAIWTPITTGGVITGYNSPIIFGNIASPYSANSYGTANVVNDAGTAAGAYEFWGGMIPEPCPALFKGTGTSDPNVFSLSPYCTGAAGSDYGIARGINSSGTVVGWDSFGGLYGTTALSAHAFIWTPNTANGTTGTFEDLNVKYASIIPTGAVLSVALGINDRGDILCEASGGSLHDRELVLISQPARFPGDANLDGTVDISDLSVVLANYDKTGMTWSQGDFDGNGTVDISDLSKILANYDKTSGAAAGVHAVPEPGTLLLLAAGLTGLLFRACRARK